MTITRHVVKSCCGKKAFIFEADKPIRKFQLYVLTGAGFTAPPNFQQIGVFYIRNRNVVATTSYGSKKFNVKCFGDDCDEKLDALEELLDIAINTKNVPAPKKE